MKFNLNEKKKNTILFAFILILAIGIRLISWPNAISQINIDEAMTAFNANCIATSGTDMYGTSFPVYLEAWGWAGQSVMLLYFMAFFIKLFGFSMITIRLPMLLISIISIIVLYNFTKRIFGNTKLALGAMAFVSICPWHFMQSIWSIDCNMFPHFMLISIYLLYRGITDKKWMLYLSMLFFALTMYTYGVSIYIVPFFLLISAIYLFIKKKVSIKNLLICIGIYLLFSAPILAMYVINALHINTNISIGPITIQYFANNARTSDMLFFSENILDTFIANLKSLSKVFLLQYDANLPWNATKQFGTLYHLSIIFFVIGVLYLVIHQEKRNIATFLFSTWLILSFFLGIVINEVNVNRLNIIWFPTIFFSFYGIYVFCNTICKNRKIVKYGIAFIYIVLFTSFTCYFYQTHTKEIASSWCFANQTTDAIHYATCDLEKEVVFYTNSSAHIYLKFQDALDNTSSTLIHDLMDFENKLKTRAENEAFIILNKDLQKTSIHLDNYTYQYFGDTVLIY